MMIADIPIPPSQCYWFRDYVISMQEGLMVTGRGTIYRVTDRGQVAKTAFAPITTERAEDLKQAYSYASDVGIRQLWITEHPYNRIEQAEFPQARIGIEKKATFLISLQNAGWKPNKKVRQNVRNFEKAGGEIKTISESKEMEQYHSLYLKSREELNLVPWHSGAFRQIWDWIEAGGDYAYVVYSELNGEMIAALSFLVGKGWVSEAHVARKEVDKVYPMESIRTRGIEIARERGHKVYNLGGVEPSPEAGSKEEGIRRNKAKYNGDYVEYNRYYLEVA